MICRTADLLSKSITPASESPGMRCKEHDEPLTPNRSSSTRTSVSLRLRVICTASACEWLYIPEMRPQNLAFIFIPVPVGTVRRSSRHLATGQYGRPKARPSSIRQSRGPGFCECSNVRVISRKAPREFAGSHCDIVVQQDFELVMAGRLTFLAALLLQPHPSAALMRVVIAHVHLQDRVHNRKVGSDLSASGSVRMAGTTNYRRRYKANFPTVTIDDVRGVEQSMAERAGLRHGPGHECRRGSSGQSAQPGPVGQADTEAVLDVDSGERQAYREGAELRQ